MIKILSTFTHAVVFHNFSHIFCNCCNCEHLKINWQSYELLTTSFTKIHNNLNRSQMEAMKITCAYLNGRSATAFVYCKTIFAKSTSVSTSFTQLPVSSWTASNAYITNTPINHHITLTAKVFTESKERLQIHNTDTSTCSFA